MHKKLEILQITLKPLKILWLSLIYSNSSLVNISSLACIWGFICLLRKSVIGKQWQIFHVVTLLFYWNPSFQILVRRQVDCSVCATLCVSVHLLKDTVVASIFWLLKKTAKTPLPLTLMFRSVCGHMLCFPINKSLGVAWLDPW